MPSTDGISLNPATCRWKNIYIRALSLDKNWAQGRYIVAPLLRGHRDPITCMDCNGDYVKISLLLNLTACYILHVYIVTAYYILHVYIVTAYYILHVHVYIVTAYYILHVYIVTACYILHVYIVTACYILHVYIVTACYILHVYIVWASGIRAHWLSLGSRVVIWETHRRMHPACPPRAIIKTLLEDIYVKQHCFECPIENIVVHACNSGVEGVASLTLCQLKRLM